MSRLYCTLPTQSYSLAQFVQAARALYDDDPVAFRLFVLTGEAPGMETQAYVDATLNALQIDHPVQMVRDFDSLIGITKNIAVDCMISVYPIPNPSEVLSTSIHLNYPIVSQDVRNLLMSSLLAC